MPIKFRCPSCDRALSVPDKHAGGIARCRSCKAEIRIPKENGVSSCGQVETGDLSATGNHGGRSGRWNERKVIGVVLGLVVASVLIITTLLVVRNRSIQREKEAAMALLTSDLDHAIAQSESLVQKFRFGEALALFEEVTPRITESSIAGFELQERLDDTLAGIRIAEQDHASKLRQGWEMFEGRFVSPEEKRSTLEQRRIEEEHRVAEAKAREEEERRLEQQRIEGERLKRIAVREAVFGLLSLHFGRDRFTEPFLPWIVDQAMRELHIRCVLIDLELRESAEVYYVPEGDDWVRIDTSKQEKTTSRVTVEQLPSRESLALVVEVCLEDVYADMVREWPERRKKEMTNTVGVVVKVALEEAGIAKVVSRVYVNCWGAAVSDAIYLREG